MQAIKLVKEQDMDLAVNYVNRIQSARRQLREADTEILLEMEEDIRRDVKNEIITKLFNGMVLVGSAAILAGVIITWLFR